MLKLNTDGNYQILDQPVHLNDKPVHGSGKIYKDGKEN